MYCNVTALRVKKWKPTTVVKLIQKKTWARRFLSFFEISFNGDRNKICFSSRSMRSIVLNFFGHHVRVKVEVAAGGRHYKTLQACKYLIFFSFFSYPNSALVIAFWLTFNRTLQICIACLNLWVKPPASSLQGWDSTVHMVQESKLRIDTSALIFAFVSQMALLGFFPTTVCCSRDLNPRHWSCTDLGPSEGHSTDPAATACKLLMATVSERLL